MKRTVLGMVFCALVPAGGALFAQQPANTGTKTSPAAQQFVGQAAQTNLTAIALGQSAEQRGSTPAVKEFGKEIVQAHTQVNRQLTKDASDLGLTMPTSMTPRNQHSLTRLNRMSGAQFDREFLNLVIRGHKAALKEMRKEVRTGTDPELKKYATDIQPSLEQHIAQAQDLLRKEPAAGSTGTASRTGSQTPAAPPAGPSTTKP